MDLLAATELLFYDFFCFVSLERGEGFMSSNEKEEMVIMVH
jgi:hypothetical protein